MSQLPFSHLHQQTTANRSYSLHIRPSLITKLLNDSQNHSSLFWTLYNFSCILSRRTTNIAPTFTQHWKNFFVQSDYLKMSGESIEIYPKLHTCFFLFSRNFSTRVLAFICRTDFDCHWKSF